MKHLAVDLELNGLKASIDEDIQELILVLNQIYGIETIYCCQGDEGEYPFPEGYLYPYLTLSVKSVKDFDYFFQLLKLFNEKTGYKMYCETAFRIPKEYDYEPTFGICFNDGKKAILAFQDFIKEHNK
jgi:hypothetical protein